MIVVDASAWIEILAGRLDPAVVARQLLVVPPHFDAEVLGTMRALQQRGHLRVEAAGRAVDRHLTTPFVREVDMADAREAWRLRESFSLTDALYVAIARRLDVAWLTADGRAGRAARSLRVRVRLV